MSQTIFFDLGNVILFFDHNLMCIQLAQLAGIEDSRVRALLFEEGLSERYERGDVSTQEICSLLQRHSSRPVSTTSLLEAMSNIFTFNDRIVPLLEALRARNVQMIILSNTCEAHFQFAIAKFPLLRIFHGYILSYEVRARKPDQRIFEAALQRAPGTGARFYTDDVEEYVRSARSYGLDAEVFKDVATLEQQLVQRGFLDKMYEVE